MTDRLRRSLQPVKKFHWIKRNEGEEERDYSGMVICPAFIDGHIHLESSMISPSDFERAVLSHGTTAVVADPPEIANVAGKEGMDYIILIADFLCNSVYVQYFRRYCHGRYCICCR